MARIYWRSSLFLYQIPEGKSNDTPIIVFWRATVYTFAHPASKDSLWTILEDTAQDELVEPKKMPPWEIRQKKAWEEEQVEPSESRGLGFYWVDISRAEAEGTRLKSPETRVEIINLPLWEKTHVRLGYEYLGQLRRVLGNAARMLWGAFA